MIKIWCIVSFLGGNAQAVAGYARRESLVTELQEQTDSEIQIVSEWN